ncbi:MAG: glycosyltransferase [Candidatus Hodarchaeota archaeon]
MKILIIADNLKTKNSGGAERSLLNLIKGFKQYQNIILKVITNRNLPFLEITNYIYFFKIIKTIKKFKPDIILTQRTIAFPSILCSLVTKVPIINIVRDLTHFCPKRMNIIAYGKSCNLNINKNQCFDCINKWRTLRILIGNKRETYLDSFSAILHNIFYKIRYYFCRFNYWLLNKAKLNLVASDLMIRKLHNVDYSKIKTAKIIPFKTVNKRFNKTEKSNYLLFVSPFYDGSGKGKDFIKRLSKQLPENLRILNVGKEIEEKNIIDLGYVSKNDLDFIYQKSKATLVPSFHTESFGRVILESIFNNTPVICSSDCGVLEYIHHNSYAYQIPIDVMSWISIIKKLANENYQIKTDVNSHLFAEFSVESCIRDLLEKIEEVLRNERRK